MPPQHVLLSQVVHARKVISPLVLVHFLEKSDSDGPVKPSQIPITILPPSQVILEDKLSHLLNHIIMRVPRIHHNLSLVFLADARILFQWPLRPILIVVVVVVGVVPLFFGLYGGEPVTVLILIFIRLV